MMIIYNVTTNVDTSIHSQWLDWIKIHIPKVLATGKFKEAKLTRVLVDEQMGGITYSVQYRALSKEALEDYYLYYANSLRKAKPNRIKQGYNERGKEGLYIWRRTVFYFGLMTTEDRA